jgi:hypothetical protein
MGDAIKPWRNWYHCMGNTYGTWLPGDSRGFRARHHREHVEGDYKFPPPPGVYDAWLARSRHLMPRGAVVIPRELRPIVCQALGEAIAFYGVQIVQLSLGGMHWHLLARFVPVGVNPYDHLRHIEVKLTHERKRSGRSRAAPSNSTESPPAPAGGSSGHASTGKPPSGAGGLSGASTTPRWYAHDVDPAPRRILGLARAYTTHQIKNRGYFTDVPGGLWAAKPKCVPVVDRDHQLVVAEYIHRHALQGSALFVTASSRG